MLAWVSVVFAFLNIDWYVCLAMVARRLSHGISLDGGTKVCVVCVGVVFYSLCSTWNLGG